MYEWITRVRVLMLASPSPLAGLTGTPVITLVPFQVFCTADPEDQTGMWLTRLLSCPRRLGLCHGLCSAAALWGATNGTRQFNCLVGMRAEVTSVVYRMAGPGQTPPENPSLLETLVQALLAPPPEARD